MDIPLKAVSLFVSRETGLYRWSSSSQLSTICLVGNLLVIGQHIAIRDSYRKAYPGYACRAAAGGVWLLDKRKLLLDYKVPGCQV